MALTAFFSFLCPDIEMEELIKNLKKTFCRAEIDPEQLFTGTFLCVSTQPVS